MIIWRVAVLIEAALRSAIGRITGGPLRIQRLCRNRDNRKNVKRYAEF